MTPFSCDPGRGLTRASASPMCPSMAPVSQPRAVTRTGSPARGPVRSRSGPNGGVTGQRDLPGGTPVEVSVRSSSLRPLCVASRTAPAPSSGPKCSPADTQAPLLLAQHWSKYMAVTFAVRRPTASPSTLKHTQTIAPTRRRDEPRIYQISAPRNCVLDPAPRDNQPLLVGVSSAQPRADHRLSTS